MIKISSQYKLIFLSSIFFTLFYNFSFFKNVINIYGFESFNKIYIISTTILLIALFTLFFSLFASKYTTKAILILTFFISSFTAYFMDSYNVVIDSEMIRNSLQTNFNESLDLFSLKLVAYVFFLAIIPSFIILKTKITYNSTKTEIYKKFQTIFLSLTIILIILFSFSKFYTSFFREHKPLRYSVNPIYWIYSVGNFINKTINNGEFVVKEIGLDAKIVDINQPEEKEKPELIIMVVGEASRADRFSLNGYEKETNPLLKNEDLISFPNISSCGTSTAHSVPCMFSIFDRKDYDYKKGVSTQNILDVLNHTENVKILWRDNNSDSKGVALRVEFEDFKTSKINTKCDDTECRDEGMLVGLDDYISKNKGKDILIVLHQMGNHGPAYFKRYPKKFEKFTPVCKTNQLENCTQEEVSNSYDNAILYTDYFLSEVIKFLKPYSNDYEAGMFYMSDHGESLGENGVYLHGMPYFMAPKEQTNVASIFWASEALKEDINMEKLLSYKDKNLSQDNLFHSLLGLFEVQSEVYKKEMDIFNDAKAD